MGVTMTSTDVNGLNTRGGIGMQVTLPKIGLLYFKEKY